MQQILTITIWIVLAAHLLMAFAAVWQTLRGENAVTRLAGLDLTSTLTIAVLVVISIIRQSSIFIDVAIAAAALGYLSTVALAKYISDQKVF
ncbi:MAG: monovalent cation/H+ antiporter complex subunit F [Anaerolineales bacterium]|nr:monovalent cation/H+ antiporter complex subunit F [Anaerolineales bacterium]MCX7754561.1 monovalent cation/H+ antiporter complex subunit F [Anaerolineales bacterium]MDW8277201.1 monovalent cation/H+ antiporter complex subunit F [Anaerolineales bacterium]